MNATLPSSPNFSSDSTARKAYRSAMGVAIMENDEVAFGRLLPVIQFAIETGPFEDIEGSPPQMAVRYGRPDMLTRLLPESDSRWLGLALLEALVLKTPGSAIQIRNALLERGQDTLDEVHWTAVKKRLDVVDALVNLGAKPKLADVNLAASHSQLDLAMHLLAHFPKHVKPGTDAAGTIMEAAARLGEVERVKQLLPLVDTIMGSPHAVANALAMAATTPHLPVIECLLDALHATYTPDAAQDAMDLALINAAATNQRAIACYLLPMANAKAENGKALRLAMEAGHTEMARELVSHTDVERVRKTWTSSKPRRWYLVDELAMIAPLDIQNRWIAKQPNRFQRAIVFLTAQRREERATADGLSDQRRRSRPRA